MLGRGASWSSWWCLVESVFRVIGGADLKHFFLFVLRSNRLVCWWCASSRIFMAAERIGGIELFLSPWKAPSLSHFSAWTSGLYQRDAPRPVFLERAYGFKIVFGLSQLEVHFCVCSFTSSMRRNKSLFLGEAATTHGPTFVLSVAISCVSDINNTLITPQLHWLLIELIQIMAMILRIDGKSGREGSTYGALGVWVLIITHNY